VVAVLGDEKRYVTGGSEIKLSQVGSSRASLTALLHPSAPHRLVPPTLEPPLSTLSLAWAQMKAVEPSPISVSARGAKLRGLQRLPKRTFAFLGIACSVMVLVVGYVQDVILPVWM
jgi:hypothetical protein